MFAIAERGAVRQMVPLFIVPALQHLQLHAPLVVRLGVAPMATTGFTCARVRDRVTRALDSIWAAPQGPLLVVGKRGTILRSTDRGRTWQSLRDPAPYLLATWWSSPHDIYAVGWVGAVLHGTGDEHWSRHRAPSLRRRSVG